VAAITERKKGGKWGEEKAGEGETRRIEDKEEKREE